MIHHSPYVHFPSFTNIEMLSHSQEIKRPFPPGLSFPWKTRSCNSDLPLVILSGVQTSWSPWLPLKTTRREVGYLSFSCSPQGITPQSRGSRRTKICKRAQQMQPILPSSVVESTHDFSLFHPIQRKEGNAAEVNSSQGHDPARKTAT